MRGELKLPRYTCPLIDKIQKAIKTAYAATEQVHGKYSAEELNEIISDIKHQLDGLSDDLEQIRDSNLALRNAAEHYQGVVEKLEDRIAALED